MVRSAAGREQLAGLAAEVVVADFDDPDAVSVALAGAQRAYLVTPSTERAQDQQEHGPLTSPRRRECNTRSSSRSWPRTRGLRCGSCDITLRWSGGSASSVASGFTFLRPDLYF
jgi:hypothetical protein